MKKKVAFANPKSILAVLLAASTLGVLAADYQSIVLSDSPVAYWRLSEAVGPVLHDLVGGHDGTALNGVIFGRPGALANDGDTDAASMAATA
jgi:hypothetical protein